jgi:RHS repeat-associated protein
LRKELSAFWHHNHGFTFTSRERHARSGLYYYRARFYSPVLGRFLSPDPIGHLGGVNLYAYVLNDPVNLIDPLGFCEESLWDDFMDWLMNDLVVPGPYGSSDPNDWGNWVSLPYEAGKFGKGWEYAEWGAIGTATAATSVAAGAIGAEYLGIEANVLSKGNIFKIVSKKLRRGFRIDPAHHKKPAGHMKYWKW